MIKYLLNSSLIAIFALLPLTSSLAEEPVKKVDPKSIYARLGGQDSIDVAVDKFYQKILKDDKVNYLFEDVNMKTQIRKQKEFLGSAFGGPNPWKGKNLRKAHANLDLTEEHFTAIAGHLSSTLNELKVDKSLVAEIMKLVGSTKDAVLNKPEAKTEAKPEGAKSDAAKTDAAKTE